MSCLIRQRLGEAYKQGGHFGGGKVLSPFFLCVGSGYVCLKCTNKRRIQVNEGSITKRIGAKRLKRTLALEADRLINDICDDDSVNTAFVPLSDSDRNRYSIYLSIATAVVMWRSGGGQRSRLQY